MTEVGQVDLLRTFATNCVVEQVEELTLRDRSDLERFQRLASIREGGARHDQRDLLDESPHDRLNAA